MKKQTLCLIFGGKSSEYKVSLHSCACILRNIKRENYYIHKIGITKEGKWYYYLGDEEKIESGEWESDKECYPITIDVNNSALFVKGKNICICPDIIFPIMHGEYCEDGAMQGFFDILGFDYVGCGKEASVVGINKHLTKLLAKENGIPISPYFVVNSHTSPEKIKEEARKIGYPVYVKATSCGSSVGVYRVIKESELILSIENGLKYSRTVLIEKEIKGTETEIAILESGGKITLGKIGQIKHKSDFYDYDTKYSSPDVELIIPAKLTREQECKIKDYAYRIFTAMGGKGLSRADFFVTGNEVIFNEINTMPGFTSGSMYPLLMREDRESIGDLIDRLLVNEI